jgi:hypothetical protein
MRDFHVEQNLAALKQAALKPFAVPIGLARKLLGEKARSQIYEAIGAGKLTAIKDNRKTLITLASIEAYMAALPRAAIKTTPRSRRQ